MRPRSPAVRLTVRLALATILALPLLAVSWRGPAIARASSPTGPPNYTVIDLGAYAGNPTEPKAINNKGDIVAVDYGNGTADALEWHSDAKSGSVTGPLVLSNLGNDHGSVPFDINDNGQIVGQQYAPNSGNGAALLWGSQGVTAIATSAIASAINSSGEIVLNEYPTNALLHNGTAVPFPPVVLAFVGGPASSPFRALTINDNGIVAGNSATLYGTIAYQATGTNGDYMELPGLAGAGTHCSFADPRGINNGDEVVGLADLSTSPTSCSYHAVLWHAGTATDLGEGRADAINNSGQIVGGTDIASGVENSYGAALLWQDGQAYDLNSLISANSGLTLSEATDINDAGQIIGIGYPLPLDPNGNDIEHAFLLNPVVAADTDPPTVTVPASPVIAEATGPNGAAVTFSASADDPDEGPLAADCTPGSGSIFPLGSTIVTCTATDAHGNTGSASFTVLVRDTTPPDLTLPADITVDATSPHGAQVLYPATAVDLVDGTDPVNCFPPSGTIFPIGSTTVNCSATDQAGNTASGSFNVHVKGATEQLNDLATLVSQQKLGPGTSLVDQLQAAVTAVAAGATASACGDLQAFIHHVQAQTGKSITTEQAASLIAAAKQITAVIGC